MPPTPPMDNVETARRAKRSATVSLVLLVGAGATAFGLARRDPSQREEDALVYGNDGACIAQEVRPAEECRAEYLAALDAYAASAPRYATSEDCEHHHGPGGCSATNGGPTGFVPRMAGYMIGRTAAQGLPAQPLYWHAPEEARETEAGSPGGFASGYCTGAGGRVYASGGGGSITHVSSTVARTTTSTPRTVLRGGFGGTGRAVSAVGGRSGGFGGG